MRVVYTPDANSEAVVEYVWKMLLDAAPPPLPERGLDDKSWSKTRKAMRARELNQMTLGILGLGRIGKRMGAGGTASGMRVLYHDLLEMAPEVRRRGRRGRDELLHQRHPDGPRRRASLQPAPAGRGVFDLLKPDAIL